MTTGKTPGLSTPALSDNGFASQGQGKPQVEGSASGSRMVSAAAWRAQAEAYGVPIYEPTPPTADDNGSGPSSPAQVAPTAAELAELVDHAGERRLAGWMEPEDLADRRKEIQDRLDSGLPPYNDTDEAGLGPDCPAEVEQGKALWDELAAKHAAKLIAPPAPLSSSVSLAGLLDEPEVATPYRVERLLPLGSRVVLAAQYKAGKTTLTGNLIRCLVNGDPFLGRFPTAPVAGKVALVDTEMSRGMLRGWLKDQGITEPERVRVELLRGRLTEFNILDEDKRQIWVDHFRSLEVEVLILDCLRPVLDAFGLNENTDAGKFLVALDELVEAAGIGELILVHHMGHNGERSRGSSRLRDWPDVEWRLVREDVDDPASRRSFSAYGRDVEVPEVGLDFNRATRHLTAAGGSRKTVRADAEVGRLVELLTATPGLRTGAIEDVLGDQGVPQNVARATIKRAIEGGRVRVQTVGRARKHYATEPDSMIDGYPGVDLSKINHNAVTSGNVSVKSVHLETADDHGFGDHLGAIRQGARRIETPDQTGYPLDPSVSVKSSPDELSVIRQCPRRADGTTTDAADSGEDVEVRRSRRQDLNHRAPMEART